MNVYVVGSLCLLYYLHCFIFFNNEQGFGVASIHRFFMGTKQPLGELTYLRIWHDNSGKGADKSWYLNRVIVDDLQEKDRYPLYIVLINRCCVYMV